MSLEEKMMSVFSMKNESLTKNQEKGIIICSIVHYLLFWFMLSVIRVFFANPGDIPTV